MSVTRVALLLTVALTASSVACHPGRADRYTRKQAQKSLTKLETPGLVIGRIPLRRSASGEPGRLGLTLGAGEQIALTRFHTYNHALVITTRHRPAEGKRGSYRVGVRHGVSPVTAGRRWTLGIIFHDAE